MSDEQADRGSEFERRFDELSAEVAAGRADMDALRTCADAANHRAEVGEEATAEQDRRLDQFEARSELDREMIAELQADALLATEHAAHLEQALRASRKIGAAIGIVMANGKVSEEVAFARLKTASQRTNRKVRFLADEVVRTGDVSGLLGYSSNSGRKTAKSAPAGKGAAWLE